MPFRQLEKIQLTWQLIWVAVVASITSAGQKRKKEFLELYIVLNCPQDILKLLLWPKLQKKNIVQDGRYDHHIEVN